MGRRDNKGERSYVIAYIRGERRLADSAASLESAMARIDARLAKPHNRGERAEVRLHGELIFSTANVEI